MTSLELTILFPAVLLIIFGAVQGALYFHGRNVVLAAAEQGVQAGRADGVSDPGGAAVQQARQFLADTSELDNLTALTITPTVSTTEVRLTVSGRTVSLLPGVQGPLVRQTAAGSRERFTNGAGGAP